MDFEREEDKLWEGRIGKREIAEIGREHYCKMLFKFSLVRRYLNKLYLYHIVLPWLLTNCYLSTNFLLLK
jgi:hypothetical protein